MNTSLSQPEIDNIATHINRGIARANNLATVRPRWMPLDVSAWVRERVLPMLCDEGFDCIDHWWCGDTARILGERIMSTACARREWPSIATVKDMARGLTYVSQFG